MVSVGAHDEVAARVDRHTADTVAMRVSAPLALDSRGNIIVHSQPTNPSE